MQYLFYSLSGPHLVGHFWKYKIYRINGVLSHALSTLTVILECFVFQFLYQYQVLSLQCGLFTAGRNGLISLKGFKTNKNVTSSGAST